PFCRPTVSKLLKKIQREKKNLLREMHSSRHIVTVSRHLPLRRQSWNGLRRCMKRLSSATPSHHGANHESLLDSNARDSSRHCLHHNRNLCPALSLRLEWLTLQFGRLSLVLVLAQLLAAFIEQLSPDTELFAPVEQLLAAIAKLLSPVEQQLLA